MISPSTSLAPCISHMGGKPSLYVSLERPTSNPEPTPVPAPQQLHSLQCRSSNAVSGREVLAVVVQYVSATVNRGYESPKLTVRGGEKSIELICRFWVWSGYLGAPGGIGIGTDTRLVQFFQLCFSDTRRGRPDFTRPSLSFRLTLHSLLAAW